MQPLNISSHFFYLHFNISNFTLFISSCLNIYRYPYIYLFIHLSIYPRLTVEYQVEKMNLGIRGVKNGYLA